MKLSTKDLALYKFQDYQTELIKQQIEEAEAKAYEIAKFHPCRVLHDVGVEDGKYIYHSYSLYLQTEPFLIIIRYWQQYKSFRIHALTHHFKNVTQNDIKGIRAGLTQPNYIGVLTTKKLNAWVEYETEVYKQAEALNNQNANKIELFLESVKGETIRWYNNNRNGEIIKNGIKFSFRIEETYVSQKIEIHYEVPNSLENFKALSENNYLKKK